MTSCVNCVTFLFSVKHGEFVIVLKRREVGRAIYLDHFRRICQNIIRFVAIICAGNHIRYCHFVESWDILVKWRLRIVYQLQMLINTDVRLMETSWKISAMPRHVRQWRVPSAWMRIRELTGAKGATEAVARKLTFFLIKQSAIIFEIIFCSIYFF